MKTKIVSFALLCWGMLTEVPGWPDAPRWMRWRRALPIVLPCVGALLLLGWNTAIRNPRMQAVRAAHQPLFALEEEIAALGMSSSEQQAQELSAKSAEVAQWLLNDPAELGPLLNTFKKEGGSLQWDATFQAADTSGETPEPDAQVSFLPVRGRLVSTRDNSSPFPSLITLLERFSATGKRIDLTRLAIRADEQGRYTAELNLRLVCRRVHEKAAQ